jgi:hypothetical protein
MGRVKIVLYGDLDPHVDFAYLGLLLVESLMIVPLGDSFPT